MNRFSSFKPGLRAGVGVVMIAILYYTASTAFVAGADTKPANAKAETTATEAQPVKKAEKKKLTGGELYAINCNRCHAERYPTEFTAAQWKTLMTHMRVRANLPAAQAKLILKYLQEDSGN
jgi:cytochrome c5